MRLQDLLTSSARFLKVQGGCGTCPRKLQDFVPATLKDTKLLIVGEAPGADEVAAQEGFIGKSGQVLRAALREVGVDEYSLTHTIHCRPPGNRDPEIKEISACLNQHVIEEVGRYPLVLLAGNIAANAFFPGQSQKIRGNLAYHPDFPNTRFFSVLHPAAIGYDPKRKEEFYQLINRFGRIFHGDTEAKFRLVTGEEFRARWRAFLESAVILDLDFETDRLESWEEGGAIHSLAACSIPTFESEVFSIDYTDPYWETALDELARFLQNPEKGVLGQNIGFDLVWMEAKKHFKCNLKYIHDTQVLYYELEGRKQAGLKQLVSWKLDGYRHLVPYPDQEKDLHKLKLYNGEDVWYVKDLFLKDFPRLRPATRDLVTRVLGPSCLALRRVTHAGIYFRSEAWEPLKNEMEERRENAVNSWQAMVPEVNIRRYVTSTGFSDLDEYIYEVRKYPVLNTTEKTGKPSTDDSTIKELIRNHGAKELQFCLDIKGLDKRISTWVKPYPKLVTKHRRIHSQYHNTTVDTSRTSSSDPNMQNNPRNNPAWKNQIRWLFGAPPGSVLLDGDFSQIELRIAFCLADDDNGMRVYITGGDVHKETAKSIVGDEPANEEDWGKGKWKDLRSKAKPVNFGCVYGAQWFTLQQYAADEYGVILTDQEAKEWRTAFFRTYPKLPDWHGSEIQKLRENKGYVESATGHVWYYKDWDSADPGARAHAERQAINMTCQGPAGNFMEYLIYLSQQEFAAKQIMAPALGGPAEVVLTVHDSLAAEVGIDHAPLAETAVRTSLHKVSEWIAPWFKVPLVLDMKTCTIWDG